jgi:hypothetical protein
MEVPDMRTHIRPATVAAFCLALTACNRGPSLDVRTFQLQHRSGYEAAELISPYVYTDRETNPGAMSPTGNALSVRETRDNLDKIARVLEEFDQPVPGLRLRFQLIEADSFQGTDPAIADVTDELRSLFRFQGYRLRGEALVAVAGGAQEQQETRQPFLGTDGAFLVWVDAQIQRPGVVRLDRIRLIEEDRAYLLETSVTVSAGQTLVIGGTTAQDGEHSYILTVSAETE